MTEHTKYINVAQVAQIMEQWAPSWTAEPWDRVGLLAGNPKAEARKIWVALELDKELLKKALAAKVDLLLTHHPPLFKPLENLRIDNPQTNRLIQAVAGGLSLFAAHTNLDAAVGGVNDALADRLGLIDTMPLEKINKGLVKLVAFVPEQDLESVKDALFKKGAGHIGQYRECAFTTLGEGSFFAPEGGNPYVGRPGAKTRVRECRLETVVRKDRLSAVISELYEAHPYEEPAFDLYELKQGPSGFGLGRVGYLPTPLKGKEFLEMAGRSLGATCGTFAGRIPEKVDKVAVLGGSGGDFIDRAASSGAQVLVTGEAGYHQGEKAWDLGICLLVLGHFQTEEVVVLPWATQLAARIKASGFEAEVTPWTKGRDPWRPVFEA
jgi:dinuclear metal center YbgI/SA1388 family protein